MGRTACERTTALTGTSAISLPCSVAGRAEPRGCISLSITLPVKPANLSARSTGVITTLP